MKKSVPYLGDGELQGDFYAMDNLVMLADFVLVGGMTLILLLVAILLKAKREFSQRLLIVFFGACFFFLLYYYAFIHRSSTIGAVAILFGYGMGYLLGPVLYFYIRSLTFPKNQLIRPLFRQLIPWFIYWLVVSLPMAVNLFDRSFFTDYAQGIADRSEYLNVIENIFFIYYLFRSRNLIFQLKEIYKDHYSNLLHRDLRWCTVLVYGLFGLLLLDIGLSLYELIVPPTEIIWNVGLFVAFAMISLFGYLGYHGIFQSRILVPAFLLTTDDEGLKPALVGTVLSERTARPYHLAGADAAVIEKHKKDLYQLLATEAPYLNEALTLSDLADRLGMSDKKLSELLNQHLQTNFYDLINHYRVEAVKEKMADPTLNHYTLLALGLDSGFNSKTSFNRIFKNKEGCSPSQYKLRMKDGANVEIADEISV